MQYATPSITTEIGAEGIASAEEWPGKVISLTPPAAFIDAACKLYREEKLWQQASQQANTISAVYLQSQRQAQASLFEKVTVAGQ